MRMVTIGLTLALVSIFAGRAWGQAAGPIRIGFISPLSGAIAAAGEDMYSGCELDWHETGFQVAGRKVQVTLEEPCRHC